MSNRKRWFIRITAIVVTLAGFLLFVNQFFLQSKQRMEQEMADTIQAISWQGADHIQHRLTSKFYLLEALGTLGPLHDASLTISERLDVLEGYESNLDQESLLRMGIIDATGTGYTTGGDTIDFALSDVVTSIQSHGVYLSVPLPDLDQPTQSMIRIAQGFDDEASNAWIVFADYAAADFAADILPHYPEEYDRYALLTLNGSLVLGNSRYEAFFTTLAGENESSEVTAFQTSIGQSSSASAWLTLEGTESLFAAERIALDGEDWFFIVEFDQALLTQNMMSILWQNFLLMLAFFATALLILIIAFSFHDKDKAIIRSLALRDKTTKLYNLNGFLFLIESKLRAKKREPYAFIHFVVHQFERIESTFGPSAGREIIQLIATILREQGYESSSAHEGFSNFFLLLPYHDQSQLIQTLQLVNERLRTRAHEQNIQSDVALRFGIYVLEESDQNAEDILSKTNIARTSLSEHSLVNYAFYQNELKETAVSQFTLDQDIQSALIRREFIVFYQPKYNVKSGRIVGAEALVRWQHPSKGLIPPSIFIPAAEQSGAIIHLGRYIFEQVCSDLAQWRDQGQRIVPISINLSRAELYQDNLMSFMQNTIVQYKINPLLVEIELTESAVSKDLMYVKSMMQQLKQANLKLLMDDFGTGYSSLSYLKTLPIDTIKLDRSFFFDIEIDAKSREIVRAIIKLATVLNIDVIAEGVETAAQVDILHKMGCSTIQGYFFSKPLTREDYEKFLRDNPFESKAKTQTKRRNAR